MVCAEWKVSCGGSARPGDWFDFVERLVLMVSSVAEQPGSLLPVTDSRMQKENALWGTVFGRSMSIFIPNVFPSISF